MENPLRLVDRGHVELEPARDTQIPTYFRRLVREYAVGSVVVEETIDWKRGDRSRRRVIMLQRCAVREGIICATYSASSIRIRMGLPPDETTDAVVARVVELLPELVPIVPRLNAWRRDDRGHLMSAIALGIAGALDA